MPFFSIITPTFNRANQLVDLISCVLAQTHQDFELIIIDDASSDNTKDLIEKYKKDSRIRFVLLSKNSGGPARPRNIGIRVSHGEWLCFLDADDLWKSTKLSNVYKLILNNPNSIVFCHDEIMINKITGSFRRLRYGPFTKNFYETLLFEGNRLSTSATTVKRDFLLSNNIQFNEDSNYTIVEDYDFWLQIAKREAKFYFHNKPLGYYVVDKYGISSDHQKSLNNLSHLLKSHVKSLDIPESSKKIILNKIKYFAEFSSAIYSFKNRNYRIFLSELFFLFFKSPKLFSAYLLKKLLRVNL